MSALLRVDALRVRLPGGAAIGPLSFALGRGEGLGIIGESGSGKSLGALALAGLLPPGLQAEGRCVLEDRTLDLSDRRIPRGAGRGIGMVFQDPLASLHPLRSVGAQLGETLRIARGLSHAATRRAIAEGLAQVQLAPAQVHNARPHQLSGGQRQRVMIALALATEPRVLVADEPTSALDVRTQREILALIDDLRRERGIGLIFIGHDLDVVASVCDRLLVLRRGAVVEQAESGSLLRAPQHEYTRALVAARHARRRVPAAAAGPADGAPLLIVRRLSVRYPGAATATLQQADFSLARGRTLAVVGESGSGKSTLARAVLRLVRALRGSEIVFDGVALQGLGARTLRPVRRRIGVVFQDPAASLDPRLTVAELLAEPLRIHRLPAPRSELAQLLASVDLPEAALERRPHGFSGGQRQRIAIARALATAPDLLVCDEAVSALDALVRDQILELLQRLQQQRGLALLFITHDLRVAEAVSDQILVLHQGRVVESGATAQVLSAPRHAFTRDLLQARPNVNHTLSVR